MLKERLLFIGIGQAGGNIANELEKKGYYAAYINTSREDLSTLETDPKNTFHVPTTSGCSKNKAKARLYVKKHYPGMLNHIKNNFPNQDIVFFVFSSSGGTGAGIAPALLDVLSSDPENEYKNYGAIMVLPSEEESIKCLVNGLNTYAELTEIENLKSVFLIDNSKGDKLELNSKFARLFDKFICSGNPDARGNIDSDELETLLTARGVTTILPVHESDRGELTLQDNVFVDYTPGCGCVGISCVNKNIEEEIKSLVEEEVGYPDDFFVGYTDKTNIVVITEMNYPDSMVNTFEEIIKTKREEKSKNREGLVRIKSSFAAEQEMDEPSYKPNKEKIKAKQENTAKKLSKWF